MPKPPAADAFDAAMLARMGALLTPPVRPITAQAIDEIKEFHIARLALVKDRTAAKNREHACRSPLLKRHATQRLAQIDRQIAAIDTALKARLRSEPELLVRFEIPVSIPGIGALTAFTMLIEIPELGQLDNKQVPASPAWHPSPATADSTAAAAISAAAAPSCAKHSTCPPSLQPDTSPT